MPQGSVFDGVVEHDEDWSLESQFPSQLRFGVVLVDFWL
jgi:hypothetical protein